MSRIAADAHAALNSGGVLALTFRDLSIERSGWTGSCRSGPMPIAS